MVNTNFHDDSLWNYDDGFPSYELVSPQQGGNILPNIYFISVPVALLYFLLE